MPSGSVDLAGKVTNQAGVDKASLTVSLYEAATWEAAGATTATTTTDSDGRWTFTGKDITKTWLVVVADGDKKVLLDSRNKIQLTNIDLIDDISVNTIYEHTAASGVTVDGVLLKDNYVDFAEATLPAGTRVYLGRDNSGDVTANVLTGKDFIVAVNGVDQAIIDDRGVDIITGNEFLINGTSVLNATTLGSGVTASSLTSVGTLASPVLTTPDINGGTADSLTSLSIRSTGAAFDLTFATATVFTAGRTLTINPGDAARTITLSGNPTLADWFDQAVKAASSPTFANLTITSFAANWTNAGRTVADLGIVTTVDINGGTVDGVTIGATVAPSIIRGQDDAIRIENPAATFIYTLTGGAILADRVLNLPVITGADTLAVLGLAQTFSTAQTFTAALNVNTANGIDYNPGSDTDIDIITLGVTEVATISWDDSETAFAIRTSGVGLHLGTAPPTNDVAGAYNWLNSANSATKSLHLANENVGANAGVRIFEVALADAGGTIGLTYMTVDKTDNTAASLDTEFFFNTVENGVSNLAATIQSTGQIEADLGAGAGNVSIFDEYDDALVLKEFAHGWANLIPIEQVQRNRLMLADMGILRQKDTGSGWMLAFQPMMRLLAGGIYQTRERFDDWVVNEAQPSFSRLEDRVKALEEANAILREQVKELGVNPRR